MPADPGSGRELDEPSPAEEVRDRDGTDEPVRQLLRRDADQRVHGQLATFQAVGQLVRADADDREVERAPADSLDHLGRRLVDDAQLDPRMTLAELPDRTDHVDAARARLDQPDGKPPLLETEVGAHLGPRPRFVGDEPPGVGQQQLAGRVSWAPRLPRTNSGAPSSCSRRLICWLSADWATKLASAALVKLRSSATAMK